MTKFADFTLSKEILILIRGFYIGREFDTRIPELGVKFANFDTDIREFLTLEKHYCCTKFVTIREFQTQFLAQQL